MSKTKSEANILAYNAPAVAEYYAALNYLTPCERLLFEQYLHSGMAILDLGVGGGRTTPYLSSIAGRYVGADYAPEMIAACRKKFPHLEFEVANAADLSVFQSASFDAAVMAFNGIDYLPDETRLRALQEIHRVLRPDGILVFSSHNPHSIWVRPSWNPQRVRGIAQKIVRNESAAFQPLLWSLTAVRVMLAEIQAVLRSLGRAARRIPTGTFWQGQGYWMDPAHGGLMTHLAIPERVEHELSSMGYRLLRVQGDDYPHASHPYITDWYYYVFSKTGATGEK
ncbi:MAG: methyltransferase domain-containing protein [Candidatus Sulfotelmatobacter sp.]